MYFNTTRPLFIETARLPAVPQSVSDVTHLNRTDREIFQGPSLGNSLTLSQACGECMLVSELGDWFWQPVNAPSTAGDVAFSMGISRGRNAACQ